MTTIKVDFYRVEISNTGNLSFENLIQQVLDKPRLDRIVTINAAPIWLVEASINNDCVEGDLIRLKMRDIPVKGSLQGIVENIHLTENEGLGIQSAFLYHIPTKVLLLENRKSGIYHSNFARYLSQINQENPPILINPILQLEALKKLDRMTDIRKVDIRVAGLDNLAILGNDDYAVKEITEMGKYFQSPYLSLQLSVGKARKKSLSLEKVKNFVTNLFDSGENQVEKLTITGNADDDESLYLDLLRDRMREEISHNSSSRTLSYKERRDCIKSAWNRRKQEIIEMYPLPK